MPKQYLLIQECDISLLEYLRDYINANFVLSSFYIYYLRKLNGAPSTDVTITTFELVNNTLKDLFAIYDKECLLSEEPINRLCQLKQSNKSYRNICRVFSNTISTSSYLLCVHTIDGVPYYKPFCSVSEIENLFKSTMADALSEREYILKTLSLNKDKYCDSSAKLSAPFSVFKAHQPRSSARSLRTILPSADVPPTYHYEPLSDRHLQLQYQMKWSNYTHARKRPLDLISKKLNSQDIHTKNASEDYNPMSLKNILNKN